MRRKIVSLNPDVVVSFVDQTNARTVSCLIGTRIPMIISERVHPAYNPIARAWRIARRLTYPLADAVVVQTTDSADWFRRWTRVRRLVVIPNAARYPQDLRIGAVEAATSVPRPLILAMGRLTRQKGFDLLLDAFQRSRLAERGWHLTILGEGIERHALVERASALGVLQSLVLPGRVGDIGQLLASADIFVLSSRYEGFPNALLEAMQMGRACVSFDCPSGPSDLIVNDRNGFLIPAEDIEELSGALQRLASDPVLRSRLGAQASEVIEQFSPAKIYGKWLRLIDETFARLQQRSLIPSVRRRSRPVKLEE
jgi:glycosyltransferase involved in cell wall biosynthesis